jgi:hypothetical protein
MKATSLIDGERAMIPRKTAQPELLWNVSLLPLPPRAARRPQGPEPVGGGAALANAAILSLTDAATDAPLIAEAA